MTGHSKKSNQAMTANRIGASRKLLKRKQIERAKSALNPEGTLLEDVFPKASPDIVGWTEKDETQYLELAARRKESGFRKRGKDTSSQYLVISNLRPNPKSAAGIIYETVKIENGMTRGTLLERLATRLGDETKHKFNDRRWCQGYIAGTIRDGFISVQTDHLISSTHLTERGKA